VHSRSARLRERLRLRHDRAVLVAGSLYGVLAVLTALVSVQPGEVTTPEAELGGLVLGVIAIATKFFYELTKKETEMGARADLRARIVLLREALPTGAFALVGVIVLLISQMAGIGQAAAYDAIYYLGLATLFTAGFLSRYAADGNAFQALIRGAFWLLLGLLILAGKKFA